MASITWNDKFFATLRRGLDPCFAIWLTDQWWEEQMCKRKEELAQATEMNDAALKCDVCHNPGVLLITCDDGGRRCAACAAAAHFCVLRSRFTSFPSDPEEDEDFAATPVQHTEDD